MQPRLLAALFALGAVAAPQSADEPFTEISGVVVEDGIELDSDFIVEPIFEILSNYTEMPIIQPVTEGQQLSERQNPNDPAKVTAESASHMKAPGGGEKGVFYRGDSRPPSVIFDTGFAPQGSDMSLRNHLSFAGNSGLVSLSRSPETAEQYAFGRSADKAQKGYIYVIAAKDVPDGYWVPGLYAPEKNPAVRRNQEFAVAGAVRPESIAHAYEVTVDKPSARGTKIKNEAYSLKSSFSCFSSKRALCDPAKYTEKISSGRKIRAKVSKSFRVSGRAGAAVAFMALSPYAHDVLDLLKQWDHPIGRAVNWFDNAMASLQEAIGGPQVPEIYGNTLKLRFICWMRGEQQWKNAVDYACDRLRKANEPKPADNGQSKRIKSVNDVLNACETLELPSTALASEQLKAELLERCEEFRAQAQELDTAAA